MTLESKKQSLLLALQRDPLNPEWHYELGRIYLSMNELPLAWQHFSSADTIAPNHPQILFQLGNVAAAQQKPLEAITYFKRSISIEETGETWFNLGNAQRQLGKPLDALKSFQLALKWLPNDAELYNNIGNVLRELGDLNSAITHYKRAIEIDPTLYHALTHLIHQQQHVCDWENLAQRVKQIRDCVYNQQSVQVSPFAFIAMPETTAAEHLACANAWVNERYAGLCKKTLPPAIFHHKKIRIGYLSADFRLHPLAFLITEMIELHNRDQFEIYAFSYSTQDNSPIAKRFNEAFDAVIDIRHQPIEEAAHIIRHHEIDILVDLTGFTQHSQTAVVAMRPARVHVNWLGYPGTMGFRPDGKPLFDYVFTDAFIHPKGTPTFLAERCCFLSPCYQPNSRRDELLKLEEHNAVSRQDCGLPENSFVFCCFNQSFKITPDIFDLWCRILNKVPNSVLWLLESNRLMKQNLIRYAQTKGVSAERFVFAPRVDFAQHLARHCHADLFLDTVPYNAHTSCSDALWMNLPILTLCGETFPSRVAASLLNAINVDELITYSIEDYERKAIELANSKERLMRIRDTIKINKQILFDVKRYVRGVEDQFTAIIQSTNQNNTL